MSTRSATSRSLDLVARIKVWPAYVFAVCCPGAGHVYVRQWMRGLTWAGLCAAALVFLSPGALLADGGIVEPIVVTALRLETVTFGDVAFPLAIVVLNVIDLYALITLDEGSI